MKVVFTMSINIKLLCVTIHKISMICYTILFSEIPGLFRIFTRKTESTDLLLISFVRTSHESMNFSKMHRKKIVTHV